MSKESGPFALYESDLDCVWRDNPVANATRRAACLARADEVTMLRAVILQMHNVYEAQKQELIFLAGKARTFDLMTEGITTPDGKRFVFRMPE